MHSLIQWLNKENPHGKTICLVMLIALAVASHIICG